MLFDLRPWVWLEVMVSYETMPFAKSWFWIKTYGKRKYTPSSCMIMAPRWPTKLYRWLVIFLFQFDIDFHISDTLARQLFSQTLATTPEEVFESLKREKVILEFEKRLMRNDWSSIDDTKETFSGSRSALLEWAPVVEEFKIQDEEIVSNSIHFKWLRVCQEFEKLTDFEKIQIEEDSDLRDRKQEIPEGS